MKTVVVRAPGGTRWRVRVNWRPRRQFLIGQFTAWRARRRKRRSGRGGDFGDFGGGDAGGCGELIGIVVIVIVGVIALAAFAWWVLLPLLLIAVDAVLVIAAIIGRVVFRRPWMVEATSGQHTSSAQVIGWRAALRRRDEIVGQLEHGQWPFEGAPPPPPPGNI